MKNKETVFRVGDKVYDANHGWGKVVEYANVSGYPDEYPVFVEFSDAGYYYTIYGRSCYNKPPSLSFTKYDYINGGFSQERPKEGFLKFGSLTFTGCGGSNYEIEPIDKDKIYMSLYDQVYTLNRQDLETLNNYLNTILEK